MRHPFGLRPAWAYSCHTVREELILKQIQSDTIVRKLSSSIKLAGETQYCAEGVALLKPPMMTEIVLHEGCGLASVVPAAPPIDIRTPKPPPSPHPTPTEPTPLPTPSGSATTPEPTQSEPILEPRMCCLGRNDSCVDEHRRCFRDQGCSQFHDCCPETLNLCRDLFGRFPIR
jgi:hypothetical protein